MCAEVKTIVNRNGQAIATGHKTKSGGQVEVVGVVFLGLEPGRRSRVGTWAYRWEGWGG